MASSTTRAPILTTVSDCVRDSVAETLAALCNGETSFTGSRQEQAPCDGVCGIISAFKGMKTAEGTGISAVAGGISEALIETAFGLLVAIPAVWAFNIFQNKVEAFTIELDNSSSELIDYFLKRRGSER